jgi:hypothetical protein
MKKAVSILPLVLILAGFGSVWAESAETLQGKWVGNAKPNVYDDWCQGAPNMTINVKANGKVKGYASDEDGNRIRMKGQVKDGQINIFPLRTPIGTIKFINVDEQTDEKITGTWQAKEGCEGTWELNKQK